MDDRKNKIRDLEAKKSLDIKARNQLLEGLGEVLFQRIGTSDPFTGDAADTPGGVLTEYRNLQKEISDFEGNIASLEKDLSRLKELEELISAKEGEKSRLEDELQDIFTRLGKILLDDTDSDNVSDFVKQQEEILLTRIDGAETKLEELERREGGIITWLGKNAQITVSKALLTKDRAALKKLYREAGESFVAGKPAESLSGDNIDDAKKTFELKGLLSFLSDELSGLKMERRKIMELFGASGSPSWRINGLEKNIARVKRKFPSVYLNMGVLAAEKNERLSSFLEEKDGAIFERAEIYKSQIAKYELSVKKIKAAINIDDENAEIEKMKKAITNQRQKIATAEETIAGIEGQIAESEKHIVELSAFIQEDDGSES